MLALPGRTAGSSPLGPGLWGGSWHDALGLHSGEGGMWAGGGALGGGPGVRGKHLVPGQVDSEAKARALPNSVCI